MSAASILTWGLGLAQGMLVLAMVIAAWRVLRGPRAQDRVLGLDTVYLNGMLVIVVHGLRTGSGLSFEAALVICLLGFAATLALAKFLMQGEVIQ
ncbi:K+/H+ antiporter subunit F [Methylobacterium sp. J-090]|uniref:K+/H+ antiporter subunit F n=1 Tax=Methylobacterium sp. J-090 TaxID=2836666 RepID=UPI001FBC0BBD|nr:K+/H+ antiporter subunit F [Methylobacterium sp. J-090]MCJ2080943.1 K+/H+ antiporter subunit F [Methylobacterium sp. J-090]